jgi:hypothetical protein
LHSSALADDAVGGWVVLIVVAASATGLEDGNPIRFISAASAMRGNGTRRAARSTSYRSRA